MAAAAGAAGPPTLDDVVAALLAGRPVVIPTDTVYGLAMPAGQPDALAVIGRLKQRPLEQALAVLVADAAQADGLAELTGVAGRLAAAFWPGALTLVVRRRPHLVDRLALGGDPATIGLRCPAAPFVRDLAARAGPLATTSANRHGDPTPRTAAEAAASLAGAVAVVVDGGTLGGRPSTVVDLTTDRWRILRDGAISEDEIAPVAGGSANRI